MFPVVVFSFSIEIMSQFLVLKMFLNYVYLETCILLPSPQRLNSFLHSVDFMIYAKLCGETC